MKSRTMLLAVTLTASVFVLAACVSQPRQLAAVNSDLAVPLEDCDGITGTRIRVKNRGNCTSVGYPLRSISADELRRTGEMDLLEALRLLDPAFQ